MRRVHSGMQAHDFRPAERVNRGLVSVLEQLALIGVARRLPSAVKPDHLTALGFGSLLAVGLSYWYARYSAAGLWLAILFLVLNWFGDSLDGTLARVRAKQRPRYGFYVDHVLDACGSVFLFAGLALSGYMSERIAVGLLVAYFLKCTWRPTQLAGFTYRLQRSVQPSCGCS
jgi:phosphatidylglycerophosphate synthase